MCWFGPVHEDGSSCETECVVGIAVFDVTPPGEEPPGVVHPQAMAFLVERRNLLNHLVRHVDPGGTGSAGLQERTIPLAQKPVGGRSD